MGSGSVQGAERAPPPQDAPPEFSADRRVHTLLWHPPHRAWRCPQRPTPQVETVGSPQSGLCCCHATPQHPGPLGGWVPPPGWYTESSRDHSLGPPSLGIAGEVGGSSGTTHSQTRRYWGEREAGDPSFQALAWKTGFALVYWWGVPIANWILNSIRPRVAETMVCPAEPGPGFGVPCCGGMWSRHGQIPPVVGSLPSALLTALLVKF